MAEKPVESISLKALVDKENNRVIFAEANEDFVDILLSFLTMPVGTIIRLIRSSSRGGGSSSSSSNPLQTLGIGCMNNLYGSLENLDVKRLQTRACKAMLLLPRNAAVAEYQRLKLKFDNEVDESFKYYICHTHDWVLCSHKRICQFRDGFCVCGRYMSHKVYPEQEKYKETVKGVFVNGPTCLVISDELEILPASIESSLLIFSKLGVTDGTTTEERNLNIGVDEVLTLLKCSLLSNMPLTETLLKHNPVPELGRVDFDQGSYIKSRIKKPTSNVHGKIRVKLMVSKSKNIVCFAEASEDFVSLLFSFLTVPLGCIVKEMHSGTSKGCITHLYNSVDKLDAKQYLKSSEHKEMLLSPKLAPNFSYENHPLGIEESKHPSYYYAKTNGYIEFLSPDETFMSSLGVTFSTLTFMDPKCRIKEATSRGFVIGPANFTVTDNLVVTPISPVSCLSLLNKLKVPFSDIEEHFVHVGTEEAIRLLVASFMSESALTNTFLRVPNPEY
ncbi:hypothetical protein Dsin_020462 [Dipteronia sinensis]|uniref:DUF674 family protein n=1 Tax=Dipteronia sinensis TaxID=43782 RepID=A0AAE0AAM2_9ROSI|nr:hypothetical protein Dsin_020462 [Dipteronia sinensis]